jgi:hypothetical protein
VKIDRYPMLGFSAAANDDTPIVAAPADVKVSCAHRTIGILSNRVVSASRRKPHLKTKLTGLPLRSIRLFPRIGKAGDKPVIVFGL